MSQGTGVGADRRRWRRLQKRVRVQMQLLDGHGSCEASGTHLSPEGIFVETQSPPASQSRVRVSLLDEGLASPLQAEGLVVQALPPDDSSDSAGVCIMFSEAGAPWHKLYELLSASLDES